MRALAPLVALLLGCDPQKATQAPTPKSPQTQAAQSQTNEAESQAAKDPKEEATRLGLACQSGDASACIQFVMSEGEHHWKELDFTKVAELLRPLCEQKNKEACGVLGRIFSDHEHFHVKKDDQRAARAYYEACELGLPLACDQLGFAYSEGLLDFVYDGKTSRRYKWPDDRSLGEEHLRKGCDTYQYARACEHLGGHHEFLGGDPKKAQEYYKKACALGSAYACEKAGKAPD